MNYLAHLLLAGEEPEAQLGGIVADFTRGRLETLERSFSPGIVRGIRIHRQLDLYTDQHRSVASSRALISPERRRYAGIMLDVFYDHLLSRHWRRFCAEDRRHFIDRMYRLLETHQGRLPERLQQLLPRMVANDWLGSYADFPILVVVFERLARRLKRENRLAGAEVELARHFDQLERDFLNFFPDLVSFAERLNQQGESR